MLLMLKLFVYKAWEIKYLYLSFWLFLFLFLPDFLSILYSKMKEAEHDLTVKKKVKYFCKHWQQARLLFDIAKF